jgi:surfactin synthase thioesterase subunit
MGRRGQAVADGAADFEIAETYEHGSKTPVSVPVHVFCGRDDATMTEAGLRAWADLTTVRPLNHECGNSQVVETGAL